MSGSHPHPAAGATVGLVLFQLCPLILVLPGVPVFSGWDGGRLLVPVALFVFIESMLLLSHWSTFMRSIALAFVWSFLVWVHPPTAGIVLAAMGPWVLYNRRPLPALGTWLTLPLLGTFLFIATWMAGRLLSGHPIWPPGTFHFVASSWAPLEQVFLQPGGIRAGDRVASFQSLLANASPSFVLLGLWMAGRSLRWMVRERRASVPEVVALLSIAFFAVVMLRSPADSASDWKLLTLMGLWCLLLARELSRRGTLGKDFRGAALLGFLFFAGISLAMAKEGMMALWRPGLSMAAAFFGGLLAAGAASYRLELARGMTFSNRLQALLVGATLGHFVIADCILGRYFLR